MKRSIGDVVGRPRVNAGRDARREDVAGMSASALHLDVASFRHAFPQALDDPMGTAESDADLMADFADFMSGGDAIDDGTVPAPDPIFREQLRRRLWRTHVHTHLRDGGETH